MPKATAAAANITDIAGSLRFRSEVNPEVKSRTGDDHFTRVTSLSRETSRPSAKHICSNTYSPCCRLFLDDKTTLRFCKEHGILRNGSSGISRESKCPVRSESNSCAQAGRLSSSWKIEEETASLSTFLYVINQDKRYDPSASHRAISDKCINLPSRIRDVSRSSGSDFLTAAAHKSG